MKKKALTPEQRRLDVDLWIIAILSLVVFGLYMMAQKPLVGIMKDPHVNVMWRVLLSASFQFGLAGLGILVVAIVRKERLSTYGLNTKNMMASIGLCTLCFVPYLMFMITTGKYRGYLPFQSVWTTREILSSGFPQNFLGLSITALVWGFFEGFNYVVISQKINQRYPSKSKWFHWGGLICAVLCIVIHGAIGVNLESLIEMLTIFVIVYGMLTVKEWTGNAWGSVFIFLFLWNAF